MPKVRIKITNVKQNTESRREPPAVPKREDNESLVEALQEPQIIVKAPRLLIKTSEFVNELMPVIELTEAQDLPLHPNRRLIKIGAATSSIKVSRRTHVYRTALLHTIILWQ